MTVGETYREWWTRRTAEALERAVAGEHPFVVVDMNAPMGTVDLESHAPKVRMSPDAWRHHIGEPPAAIFPGYEPIALLDGDDIWRSR